MVGVSGAYALSVLILLASPSADGSGWSVLFGLPSLAVVSGGDSPAWCPSLSHTVLLALA